MSARGVDLLARRVPPLRGGVGRQDLDHAPPEPVDRDRLLPLGELVRELDQVPVVDVAGEFVGSLNDTKVLKSLLENPEIKSSAVSEIMDPPFQFVGMDNTIDVLSSLISKNANALLVRDDQNKVYIVTQSDLLMAISSN